jgi:hypothetical protein
MGKFAILAVWIVIVVLGPIGPLTLRAQQTVEGMQASQDAYQRAEAERRTEIQQQTQLTQQLRWQNAWAYPPYTPTLADIYGSGYVPRPARTFRQAVRLGYAPAFSPWPRVPGDIYGYPYYGFPSQPIGHTKMWIGQNGYVYRPIYPPPVAARVAPPLFVPNAPPLVAQPSAATLAPQSPMPGLEPIPAPPAEAGPREF